MYILGRTLAQGRSAGFASVLGISAGCAVHTLAGAVGVSSLLARSALAFSCLKFAGAAYLVYLGVGLFRDGRGAGQPPTADHQPLTGFGMLRDRTRAARASGIRFPEQRNLAIFRQAMATNVLNPKVALFFLAFLPQFVAPFTASKFGPLLFLGGIFIFNGTLYCAGLVFFAAKLAERFRENPSAGRFFKRLAGGLFVGLGVRLASER
jgi:threonine/homoserine/homoserine lactone efflux protein